MTDVNFRHSSQYCKVSKKLCTKNDGMHGNLALYLLSYEYNILE